MIKEKAGNKIIATEVRTNIEIIITEFVKYAEPK